MDPVETDELPHEMEDKHTANATRVISNLRRCIHECIPAVRVSTAGWTLQFSTGMHRSCDMEESWIYAMHCLRDYNGEKVSRLTDRQIEFLGKSLVYKMVSMKENRARLPYCMKVNTE
ncbi:uncharacterized protein LOC125543685 isoform X2 [Triticum urartu]|uniref:uncharacterized protein LOC125543685 isoform X2 n=1 Tax=Triticum urartu TaxID=4572 RepID=UPI0020430671|nr:uncharacterized protein LOC125543685 isoform X2 [Triticum urartu]XP_048563091.1 uncharacterized protein LOC125543685 isoform X2 [Triticum urartu]